jgi:anti-sigma regulatory factor (Ser/Thr protein kinase)
MFITKHPAELSNLRAFKDALDGYLQPLQIPAAKIQDIELAIEELIVNVMLYGYPESSGDIELHGDVVEQNIIFQIIDQGVPFDPTTVASPELDGPIENRIQGGMGIYLAKSLVDSMKYQRCGNNNVLTLTIKKRL